MRQVGFVYEWSEEVTGVSLSVRESLHTDVDVMYLLYMLY